MDVTAACRLVSDRLDAAADPSKAGPMAAYMKTSMPFYGVQKAGRTPILRALIREHPPASIADYRHMVEALWALEHREEKYLAIGYGRSFDSLVTTECMGLYQHLIVAGAWWDFVDEIATKLVGRVLIKEPMPTRALMVSWATADDLWMRRTAIICQLPRKGGTDTDLLSEACASNFAHTDFFIRKAIGWALREFSKTDPEWVSAFVDDHADEMSKLSIREATRLLPVSGSGHDLSAD